MNIDNKNYTSPIVTKQIIELFGWYFGDATEINGVLIFRPDFYEKGHIIARSKKALIKCDGETLFLINGKEFTSIKAAIDRFGLSILDSITEWDWKVEKEWQVIKLNGEWVSAFSTLDQLPWRKKVGC
jgi:hypothetical protein